MKTHTLLLAVLAALMGAAVVSVLPALAAAPSEAKLEVNENCEVSTWSCWTTEGSASIAKFTKSVTIASGGTVTFIDHATTAAGVIWTGSAPACTGVPTTATANWEGKCKFEQPGTYKFESSTLWPEYTKYEIVVEGPATGTTHTPTNTTPTTTTPTSPTTPSEPGHGSPLDGGSKALELAGSQRGSTVHGSIEISQAGVGGRLEVALFTAVASLAKTPHPAQVRVGRLVRTSLQAGSVSFSVPLGARGTETLRRHRHRRLALTVKITLTPQHGAAVMVTRGVLLQT